jgi:hypothetical protein
VRENLPPVPETEVAGNLIVPAAAAVEFARSLSNPLAESLFEVDMNVFKLRIESESTRLDVRSQVKQRLGHFARLFAHNDTRFVQSQKRSFVSGKVLSKKRFIARWQASHIAPRAKRHDPFDYLTRLGL